MSSPATLYAEGIDTETNEPVSEQTMEPSSTDKSGETATEEDPKETEGTEVSESTVTTGEQSASEGNDTVIQENEENKPAEEEPADPQPEAEIPADTGSSNGTGEEVIPEEGTAPVSEETAVVSENDAAVTETPVVSETEKVETVEEAPAEEETESQEEDVPENPNELRRKQAAEEVNSRTGVPVGSLSSSGSYTVGGVARIDQRPSSQHTTDSGEFAEVEEDFTLLEASGSTTGRCGPTATYRISGNVLTISGSGSMYNYPSFGDAPWYWASNSITSVVISEGITTIGEGAFYGMERMLEISLPNTLRTIGDSSFFNAKNLQEIYMPDSVTTVGDQVFRYCSGLQSVRLSPNINYLGFYTFGDCTGLTSVRLPKNITEIDDSLFLNCSNLETVIIYRNVHIVDWYAFRNCNSLTEVFYEGSEDELYQIEVWDGNDALLNANIYVNYVQVTGIRATEAEMTIEIGEVFSPVAIYSPENATVKFTYIGSDDYSIASVAENGDVTGRSVGTTRISYTSRDGSYTAYTTLHVVKEKPYRYMYRMYNPNSGEHFYTGNVAERNHLIDVGWNYEGVGFKAPKKSNTPMYRLYNPNAGDHHYTSSVAERDHLVSVGWNYEGIGWYADDNKQIPQYRLYNPNATGAGSHHYTSNVAERNHLISIGWNDEGIGFYTCR